MAEGGEMRNLGAERLLKRLQREFLRKSIMARAMGLKDPVHDCKVYKQEGCSHIDGFLCDMKTCSLLKEFSKNK